MNKTKRKERERNKARLENLRRHANQTRKEKIEKITAWPKTPRTSKKHKLSKKEREQCLKPS